MALDHLKSDPYEEFFQRDLPFFIRTAQALGSNDRGNWHEVFAWLKEAAQGTIPHGIKDRKMLSRPDTLAEDFASLILAILYLCAFNIAEDDRWEGAQDATQLKLAKVLNDHMYKEFVQFQAGFTKDYDRGDDAIEGISMAISKNTDADIFQGHAPQLINVAMVISFIRRMFEILGRLPETQSNMDLRTLLAKRLAALPESCEDSRQFSNYLEKLSLASGWEAKEIRDSFFAKEKFPNFHTYIRKTAPNMTMGVMLLMAGMTVKPQYAGEICFFSYNEKGEPVYPPAKEQQYGLAHLADFLDRGGRYCNDISSAAREIPKLQANGFLYLALQEEGVAVLHKIQRFRALPSNTPDEKRLKAEAEQRLIESIMTEKRIQTVLQAFFENIDQIGKEPFHPDLNVAHYQVKLREFLSRELSVTPPFIREKVLKELEKIERKRRGAIPAVQEGVRKRKENVLA